MALNTFPCNPYPISTEEMNKGNNDDVNARVATLEETVTDLNSNKANQITIAPFFNAETAYDPGDLVYYNGLIYRCVNAHAGEWDADDFAATTIAGELDTLKSGLTNLYLGNPTSVTEKVLECLADNNVNYTVPEDGWYRVILINNSNAETSLRLNNLGFMYLDSTGKLDAVIPFKKGAFLSADVTGNGIVWVNKYNFGS